MKLATIGNKITLEVFKVSPALKINIKRRRIYNFKFCWPQYPSPFSPPPLPFQPPPPPWSVRGCPVRVLFFSNSIISFYLFDYWLWIMEQKIALLEFYLPEFCQIFWSYFRTSRTGLPILPKNEILSLSPNLGEETLNFSCCILCQPMEWKVSDTGFELEKPVSGKMWVRLPYMESDIWMRYDAWENSCILSAFDVYMFE